MKKQVPTGKQLNLGAVLEMYLSKEYKNRVISFLLKAFDPMFIYLFGSFAKGEGREDSDIDIAIYTDQLLPLYILFTAANKLSFEVNTI
ncbi:Nucleotidyltransferase domain-containing protein [Geosporobacter subterraneus DSM 17957]|uniref:Nucleotidyltransferase domain-containing protein n=1 Tax=Geosporobacter subterraneus DSM 17957 TaxID=1121919 RepID=A0A1M6MU85_9FIRM|nr:nucleotidyltransferase domain-containing protein [Geosporobacter subterraneus]SHJ86972.1 Nucleotidyltransferase domain-containing protein [Geosporobacter subterraneus DSM 17957]